MHYQAENIIDVNQANCLLKNHYDIDGKLIPLPGEIDLNFKVKVANENKYVLKITELDENRAYLDFQEKKL